MTTVYVSDVAVSSHYALRGEGWMNVYLNDGHILKVHCPQISDNWAQDTKRVCNQALGKDEQVFQMKSLLLQPSSDGGYVMLQGEVQAASGHGSYIFNIPAAEIQHMLAQAQPQRILGSEFVMVVLVIVMAMFGLKWMLEKYLLPHFSE